MSACYRLKETNDINDISNVDSPCATLPSNSSLFVPCCTNGDQCLQYGLAAICHYTHALTGGSGYYAGGCTDPTFKDASCDRECADLADQEIVYDDTNSLWRCCGSTNGTPTCESPTNETFQAASPGALEAYSIPASTSVSGTTVSTSTGAAAATSSTASASSQDAPASMSLSTGALAGIIVGSIVGGGLLVTLFSLALRRVWKRRRLLGVDRPANNDRGAKREDQDLRRVEHAGPQEIDGRHLGPELGQEGAKHELPAT
ncbi:hypothetical protein MMC10_002995 [Thelotrema lepadinum]|nr:hypothetical protein [Thelotrema lepadinum]